MKEYLKMANQFSLPVNKETLEIYCREHHGETFSSGEEYAAHAINSHDELVAEVERLRSHLAKVKLLCGYFANCGGWDINAYSEYVNANIYPIWSPPEEVE